MFFVTGVRVVTKITYNKLLFITDFVFFGLFKIDKIVELERIIGPNASDPRGLIWNSFFMVSRFFHIVEMVDEALENSLATTLLPFSNRDIQNFSSKEN